MKRIFSKTYVTSPRLPLRWPERALRLVILFVTILAFGFLAMIPASILSGETALLVGWFFGPLLLAFVPLLLFIYTGMRQKVPTINEIILKEEKERSSKAVVR